MTEEERRKGEGRREKGRFIDANLGPKLTEMAGAGAGAVQELTSPSDLSLKTLPNRLMHQSTEDSTLSYMLMILAFNLTWQHKP